MPLTSASKSASSTSLSLSGRMTATMSFMLASLTFGGAPLADQNGTFATVVRIFAVLHDIHADPFFPLARAQADGNCDQPEQDEGHHYAVQEDGGDGDGLNADQSQPTVDQSICLRVPRSLGEDTGQQGADDTAESVRCEDVE